MTIHEMLVSFFFFVFHLHSVVVVNGFFLLPGPIKSSTAMKTAMKNIWSTNVFHTSKKLNLYTNSNLETSAFQYPEDVRTVPCDAPLEVTYGKDKFYIRSCYDQYYPKIMKELFGKMDYFFVSVTGTPGIGKSIFYLYFLHRYQTENPGKSVITASFSKDRKLQDCKLFRSNGEVEVFTDTFGYPYIPRKHTSSWPNDIDCDLYLYDGPPMLRPNDVKMIAFTSPNFSWLDSMRKESKHSIVFMPTWDCDELLAANKALELNIDEKELIKRFTLFGGSAKYCLSTDDTVVLSAEKELDTILSGINDIDEVERYFTDSLDVKSVVHRLMHYIPENNTFFANLYPASPSISKMLYRQLKTTLKENQYLVSAFRNGNEQAGQMAQWLFTHDTHELLSNGGRFHMQSLSDSSDFTLDINPTVGEYSQFIMDPDEVLRTNMNRMPDASNYPLVDSYMLSEKSIMLFQITIKRKHPVKSSGLIQCLQSLDQLNRVKANPLSAQLVFVVPKGLGYTFRSQDIEFSETWTRKEMGIVDCIEIPGIGPKKRKKLSELGIENSAQLMEAYNRQDKNVEFVRGSVKKWMDDMEQGGGIDFLERIPQYVMEI
jgi:hypothetical protein